MATPTLPYPLLSPEFYHHPYPVYHTLQQHEPIHWSDDMGAWYVTRYADVAALLRDPRLTSNRTSGILRGLTPEQQVEFQPLRNLLERWPVFTDPPRHTHLRALLTRVFPPRFTSALQPRVAALVDELLAPAAARGRADLMPELAYPLPALIIGELLGARREDQDQLQIWSEQIVKFGPGRFSPDDLRTIQRGFVAMTEYFRQLLDSGQAPPDSIAHQLMLEQRQDPSLDAADLLAICTLMMFAGHETTMNLIANGALTLLEHPDQLALLREQPGLIKSAVEEVLRYECPIQNISRGVIEEIEVGGVAIKRGQRVVLAVGAANRDPQQFPEPERFDIRREPNRHIAFGHGIHFCLGAQLARLEGQIALGELVRRFPRLRRAAGRPTLWKPLSLVREMQALHVEL